jgi:hypothetical protein
MNISYENIIIAIIYLLIGIYSLVTGILALAKRDIRVPGFYQFGAIILRKVRGQDKVARFENDMLDRKKVIRYGIFWIFMGLIALAGGIFVLLFA